MGLKDFINEEVDKRFVKRSKDKATKQIIVSHQYDKLGRLSDDKKKVLLSNGEEKDAVIAGDPNQVDNCINITSDKALINNDFVYSQYHDLAGNVLLIQTGQGSNLFDANGHRRYTVKDILLDTLWPIDVHAVTGITPVPNQNPVQTIKFSPDGKHIFCGAVLVGDPDEDKTTLKWGYIKDFVLSLDNAQQPVILGTVVQGSFVIDSTDFDGFEAIPEPPSIEDAFCTDGFTSGTTKFDVLSDDHEAYLFINLNVHIVFGEYALSIKPANPPLTTEPSLRIDFVGDFLLNRNKVKVMRIINNTVGINHESPQSFHCLGPFCNGEIIEYTIKTDCAAIQTFSYGPIDTQTGILNITCDSSYNFSRTGCLPAFACSDNGLPADNPGKCGPVGDDPNCFSDSASGSLSQNAVISLGELLSVSNGGPCFATCSFQPPFIPNPNHRYTENYNIDYGILSVEDLDASGSFNSLRTRWEKKRVTLQSSGGTLFFNQDFTDNGGKRLFSIANPSPFKASSLTGPSAAIFGDFGDNNSKLLYRPYLNFVSEEGGLGVTVLAVTDNDIFKHTGSYPAPFTDAPNMIRSRDSELFETAKWSGLDNDITVKRISQNPVTPSEFTEETNEEGQRSDRSLWSVIDVTTRNED